MVTVYDKFGVLVAVLVSVGVNVGVEVNNTFGVCVAVFVTDGVITIEPVGVSVINRSPLFAAAVAIIGSVYDPNGIITGVFVAVLVKVAVPVAVAVADAVGVSLAKRNPWLAAAVATAGSTLDPKGIVTAVFVAVGEIVNVGVSLAKRRP